ncbi:hypothetical protein GF369_01100 [Candidatus Peregrinibacteria bacterium]|nr:hypothetical protein [Candidatus Peregrinibacteria bacterium]
MDRKTKINTIISIVLVTLIAAVTYWAQVPTQDLKAELVDTDTVLVRIQDFAFDPDIVRIEPETTVSWLHDEPEENADVQHGVSSYDPEGEIENGAEFKSAIMTQGDTFSHTFNEAGVYYYDGGVHPFMTGKVCVGEESEELDEDCVIEVDTGGSMTDDEADEMQEEGLDSEDDITADETDETDEEEDLLPAADEDFDTSTIDDAETETVEDTVEDEDITLPEPEETTPAVTTTQTTTQDPTMSTTVTSTQEKELADSGPEDAVYLLVGLFALFVGRKLARNEA